MVVCIEFIRSIARWFLFSTYGYKYTEDEEVEKVIERAVHRKYLNDAIKKSKQKKKGTQ